MVVVHSSDLEVQVLAAWEMAEADPPAGRFAVVSITTPGDPAADLRHLGAAAGVLRLEFREGALTDDQARAFWRWWRPLRRDGLKALLIHCGAGAVRSPAFAAAVLDVEGDADSHDAGPLWDECAPDEHALGVLLRASREHVGSGAARPVKAGEADR